MEQEQDEHGPITRPADRYFHLPVKTREWLESLRENDITELNEAIRFYHATKTVGRFWRWMIITFVGIFVGAVGLGEAGIKAFNWLFGRGQ